MTRPVLGALAVVTRGDHVLLVQRANPPDQGLWGYPGGKVEWGETVAQAAVRELREETGIAGRADKVIGTCDLIAPGAGRAAHHYFLVGVRCHYDGGTACAADDAAAAAWMPIDDVLRRALPMSADVDTLLHLALAP